MSEITDERLREIAAGECCEERDDFDEMCNADQASLLARLVLRLRSERDAAQAKTNRLVQTNHEHTQFKRSLCDDRERIRAERDKARRAVRFERARVTTLETALGRISEWTSVFGKSLCPPTGVSDTYGEGVRESKNVVRLMLRAALQETP